MEKYNQKSIETFIFSKKRKKTTKLNKHIIKNTTGVGDFSLHQTIIAAVRFFILLCKKNHNFFKDHHPILKSLFVLFIFYDIIYLTFFRFLNCI
jgi:hypothetical protein